MTNTGALKVDRRRSEHRTRCIVCNHPERARIEMAMARGSGRRAVGQAFNVSPDSVYAHWDLHTSEAVKLARKAEVLKPGALLEQLVIEEDTGLLENLRILRAGLLHRYDLALTLGDDKGVAALAAQLHKNAELTGKYTGEIRAGAMTSITNNNLMLSPDWLAFRLKLTQALRLFPEAAASVAALFKEAEAPTLKRIGPPIEGGADG